ncbi:hypothetical protein DBR42_13530 [Pelomonas sp. HMWF004]|nr:hypothetical protein DBR42_13530 [Pelomonas sp. HMWF004]
MAPARQQAWQLLATCRPVVALIDIQRPVIAFTAFAMPGNEQRFRAAGCCGCIAKPIDVRSFAAQVREVLAAPLPGLAATGGGSGT